MGKTIVQKDLSNVYSTSEIKVGTWINGKPIYRKTVLCSCNTSPNNTTPHGISNLDTVIRAYGFSKNTGDQGWRYLVQASYSEGIWNRAVQVYPTYILIEAGSSIAGQSTSMYVTIEYTKTTD